MSGYLGHRVFILLAVMAILLTAGWSQAHAYRVSGTVRVTYRAVATTPPSPDIPGTANSYTRTSEYSRTREIDAIYRFTDKADTAGSPTQGMSAEAVVTEIRYDEQERHGTELGSMQRCRGVDTFLRSHILRTVERHYQGPGEVRIGPIFNISILPAVELDELDRDPLAPVPLRVELRLSGVQAPAGQTWLFNVLNQFETCDSTKTSTDRYDESKLAGPVSPTTIFFLPDLIPADRGAEVVVKKVYSPQELQEFWLEDRQYTVQSVEVDLRIKLASAVAKVEPRAVVRGGQVAFDASAARDFDLAYWIVKNASPECLMPSAPTAAGSRTLPESLRNPERLANAWSMRVREHAHPDTINRNSPVLCPITAQLFASEYGYIRSLSEPVAISVSRRDWSTTVRHAGAANVTTVHDDIGSNVITPLAEFLSSRRENAVAMNVRRICVEGNAYLRGYNCFGFLIEETGLLKLHRFVQVKYVTPEREDAEQVSLDTVFSIGSSSVDGERQGEGGPFAGMYYFDYIDDDVFDEVTLRDPASGPFTGRYGTCVELHEHLHSLVRDKAVRWVGSGTRLNDNVYDPKRVLEQVYETTLTGLLIRMVWLLDDFANVEGAGDAKHEVMTNWQSVVEGETFNGQDIGSMIQDFIDHPVVQGGQTCGGRCYPLSDC